MNACMPTPVNFEQRMWGILKGEKLMGITRPNGFQHWLTAEAPMSNPEYRSFNARTYFSAFEWQAPTVPSCECSQCVEPEPYASVPLSRVEDVPTPPPI